MIDKEKLIEMLKDYKKDRKNFIIPHGAIYYILKEINSGKYDFKSQSEQPQVRNFLGEV